MHIRKMDIKSYSGEISEMRNMLLETKVEMILVIKWQRIWLKYLLLFCGRWNLCMLELDI